MLRFMASQRSGHYWVTELNWTIVFSIVSATVYVPTNNVGVSFFLPHLLQYLLFVDFLMMGVLRWYILVALICLSLNLQCCTSFHVTIGNLYAKDKFSNMNFTWYNLIYFYLKLNRYITCQKSFQPDIHLEISRNAHKEADRSTTLPMNKKITKLQSNAEHFNGNNMGKKKQSNIGLLSWI